MEHPVLEDLLQVGGDELLCHLCPIDAGGGDGVVVAQPDRRDVLEGQNPQGRLLPRDLRHADALVVPESLAEVLGVAGLGEVVDLREGGHGELLHQRGHVGPAANRLVSGHPAAHLAQRGQVDLHDLVDRRTLHLDDNGGEAGVSCIARQQHSPVRLPQ